MFDNGYKGNIKSRFMPVITYFKRYTKSEARIFTHMHYHDYFEFLYIKSGKAKMLINARSFEAQTGSLIVINPYETHYGEILSEALEYYCIVFDIKSLSLEHEESILSGKVRYENHIPDGLCFESIINAVNDAYFSEKPGWDLRAKGSLLLIFSALAENLTQSVVSSRYIFEKKVIDYVTENYMHPISSNDVSLALGYNQNYFCRAFKNSFSQRFCDYLGNYRIGHAKELLKHYSVSEVSFMTGFSNINYFSSVFKSITGMSPSKYKQQLANKSVKG